MAAVLVLDNDPAHAELLAKALGGRGHAVVAAASATAAVQALREGGIDVVVLHHNDQDVTEIFIAGLHKLPDPPPFIMVSGAVDAPGLSARLGAAAFLLRPCTPDEILAAVDRIVATRSTPHEIDGPPTRPVERP